MSHAPRSGSTRPASTMRAILRARGQLPGPCNTLARLPGPSRAESTASERDDGMACPPPDSSVLAAFRVKVIQLSGVLCK